MLKKLSLRARIFVTMVGLVVATSVLIAGVTVYQYKEQSQDYHQNRLKRKEEQLRKSLHYFLREEKNKNQDLMKIFQDPEIYQIADIHNLNFVIYDLEGNFVKSSQAKLDYEVIPQCLDVEILNQIDDSEGHRYVEKQAAAGEQYRASYFYLVDDQFKPIGILNLPYYEDNSASALELREFLGRLSLVYLLMLISAVLLSYFVSKYITRSLKAISSKIDQTRLSERNEKIFLNNPSHEIGDLINAYNAMVDELEESAALLAKSEREQAWREMAKQVAHEIKNPLTPMRLTVQSFQRKFDPEDPEVTQKLNEYSNTLIQQIDTMSSIASAFSNFADMPAQQNETLNIVGVVRLALEIFNEKYIHFIAEEEEIIAKLDRTQLIRIITNLVKNAIQAIPLEQENKRILISIVKEGQEAKIMVADNGVGIRDSHTAKVFEPKFTTKSSGMGLGLAMVKKIVETYKGSIGFTSTEGKGTVFTVKLPVG